MIRILTMAGGHPLVMLGLDAQNLDRLREGQPILVNLRHLDPSGPPITMLPEIQISIFFGGTDEADMIKKKLRID